MIQPLGPTIPDLLAYAARAVPNQTALETAGGSVTYTELDRLRISCAHVLVQEGVTPGARVLLVAENSIEYVVALFGIVTARAAAVPIPVESTAEKILDAQRRLGASHVVATRRTIAALPGVRGIALEVLMECVVSEDLPRPNPADVGLLLPTSGTTSAPKTVVLTHANFTSNARGIIDGLKLTSADSVVTVLPFCYSFGNSVLLTHLGAGAKIVIENRFLFPNTVVETISRARPTGFYGVPTTFYILLNRSTFPQRDWSFLRYVAQAGGAMRVETIRRLQQLLPGTEIYIMYGQTEASARITILPAERLEEKLGSIGKPLQGIEIRILAEPGEAGELQVRGPNVMRGYFEDPENTSGAICDGWLNTGDIVRQDAEGFLYVVGRKSDFIKCAAVRISPGEIEEVIAQLPGVEDVAAFGLEDALLGEALAVCLTGDPSMCSAAAVIKHCESRLPSYKVPKYVLWVPSLPCTQNGKKQYFRLREKYKDFAARAAAAEWLHTAR